MLYLFWTGCVLCHPLWSLSVSNQSAQFQGRTGKSRTENGSLPISLSNEGLILNIGSSFPRLADVDEVRVCVYREVLCRIARRLLSKLSTKTSRRIFFKLVFLIQNLSCARVANESNQQICALAAMAICGEVFSARSSHRRVSIVATIKPTTAKQLWTGSMVMPI